jgi:hypothetical protein
MWPWLLNWGSTPEERRKSMPEDALMPEGSRGLTRAVTVEAPVEEVWPWLAQLGQDRGGFYSYEWLENLAGCRMRNADRIHPEWQHRDVGETVLLHPVNGLKLGKFEPNRAFTLEDWGSRALLRWHMRACSRSRTSSWSGRCSWGSRLALREAVRLRPVRSR